MSDYAIAVVHEPLVRPWSASWRPGVRLQHRPPRPRRPRILDRVLHRLRRAHRAARLRLPGRVAAAVAGPDGVPGRSAQPAPGATARLTLDDLAAAAARGRGLRTGRSSRRWTGSSVSWTSTAGSRCRWPAGCRCRSSSRAPTWSRSCPRRLARIHTGAGRAAGPASSRRSSEVLLAEGYWFAADRLSDPAHQWLFARLDEVAECWPQAPDDAAQLLPVVAVSAPSRPAR